MKKISKFIQFINIEKKQYRNINKFNYGISILKVLLAFSVISTHCFNKNSTKNKIVLFLTKNRRIHVPSFIIISFYFLSNNFVSFNLNYLLRRIKRILMPYIFWPIIIWIISIIFNLKKKDEKFPDSYQELKLQLLWGSLFIPQFWFQWDLMAITFVFYIIIQIFRKHSLFILQLLLIMAYISQYSSHYSNYFTKFPLYNKYTIGRILELIPFAISGFIFGFYKFFNIIKKNKVKTVILSIVIYNSIEGYNILTYIYGFGYSGIKLNIQSMCLIDIFSLFPSESINNYYLIKVITLLTKYTAGIFYLHISIYNFFKFYINDIKNGSFFGIILNYCICYTVCQIGMIFFSKTLIKYLFC